MDLKVAPPCSLPYLPSPLPSATLTTLKIHQCPNTDCNGDIFRYWSSGSGVRHRNSRNGADTSRSAIFQLFPFINWSFLQLPKREITSIGVPSVQMLAKNKSILADIERLTKYVFRNDSKIALVFSGRKINPSCCVRPPKNHLNLFRAKRFKRKSSKLKNYRYLGWSLIVSASIGSLWDFLISKNLQNWNSQKFVKFQEVAPIFSGGLAALVEIYESKSFT